MKNTVSILSVIVLVVGLIACGFNAYKYIEEKDNKLSVCKIEKTRFKSKLDEIKKSDEFNKSEVIKKLDEILEHAK